MNFLLNFLKNEVLCKNSHSTSFIYFTWRIILFLYCTINYIPPYISTFIYLIVSWQIKKFCIKRLQVNHIFRIYFYIGRTAKSLDYVINLEAWRKVIISAGHDFPREHAARCESRQLPATKKKTKGNFHGREWTNRQLCCRITRGSVAEISQAQTFVDAKSGLTKISDGTGGWAT